MEKKKMFLVLCIYAGAIALILGFALTIVDLIMSPIGRDFLYHNTVHALGAMAITFYYIHRIMNFYMHHAKKLSRRIRLGERNRGQKHV